MEVIATPIADLNLYPKNPRVGNVDLIAESLKTYGQYKPITVNKATNQILAGNHTFQAAQSLGWETIDAVYVDVDEQTAAKIVAMDNRTSDTGSYDDEALLALLKEITDLEGTGYTPDDLDDLVAELEEAAVPDLADGIQQQLRPAYDPDGVGEGDGVKRVASINELAERYNDRATRMMVLDYPNEDFVWMVTNLNDYRTKNNLESNSAAVKKLLEDAVKP